MKELMLQTQTEGRKDLPMVRETQTVIEEEDLIQKKIQELKSMGFHHVAKKAEAAHKMSIAYGLYTFISQETVGKFNMKLREETLQEDKRARRYKKLVFIPIDQYDKIPPPHVLDSLAKAKIKGLFDRFEVGKIDWVEEIKDPIIFGRIDGYTDYFFIAQWDNDVRIEDLLSI